MEDERNKLAQSSPWGGVPRPGRIPGAGFRGQSWDGAIQNPQAAPGEEGIGEEDPDKKESPEEGEMPQCLSHPSGSPGVWELPAWMLLWMGSLPEPLGKWLYLRPEFEMWIKQSWQGNYSSLSNIALGLLAADSPRVMNPFVFAAALDWLQEKVQTGREVLH